MLARWCVDSDLIIQAILDRKSTRLNSSHGYISYAVFCLKKKKKTRPSAWFESLFFAGTPPMATSNASVLRCVASAYARSSVFFFNDTATTEIYTLSLHDALPISFRRYFRHRCESAPHRCRRATCRSTGRGPKSVPSPKGGGEQPTLPALSPF